MVCGRWLMQLLMSYSRARLGLPRILVGTAFPAACSPRMSVPLLLIRLGGSPAGMALARQNRWPHLAVGV